MNIYFSGIGGVGIGPLAEIALDAGFTVSGSDATESLMTKELRARGITVTIGQDGSFLKNTHSQQPIDWFVHTAALPHDHPELVAARELGIKTAKRDELLAHVIDQKNLKLIAIAGTHGKTNTTGMAVWVMQQLGIAVSYSIGAGISFGSSGHYDPESQYFIYECDEFDRNFLQFSPHLSVITSIDYDHPDTYPEESEYTAAFRQFVDQSDQVVMWQSDANYIQTTASHVHAIEPDGVHSLTIPGQHSRRNASLILQAFAQLGIGDNATNTRYLEAFPGTSRRFEKLADNLYTDYGHHPIEISATLQMARELSDNVVLVYQPHQNIRQHEIIDQYQDTVFTDATELFWLPTYLSRENPDLAILTPQQLTAALDQSTLHFVECNDTLWNMINQRRQAGALVLVMGAGSIDGWVRERLETPHGN